jgi:hypothetical protein
MGDERRYKLFSIPDYLVLNMLYMDADARGHVVAPVLPEDASVIAVYYRHEAMTFDFVIESATFPPLQPGTAMEYLERPSLEFRLRDSFTTPTVGGIEPSGEAGSTVTAVIGPSVTVRINEAAAVGEPTRIVTFEKAIEAERLANDSAWVRHAHED